MGEPIALMTAAAVVTAVTAVALWQRRSAIGAPVLAVMTLATSWWAAVYAAELAASEVDLTLLLGDLKYVGITIVPPAWLVFALQYTGRSRLVTRRLLLALSVHPIATMVLLGSSATHDLVRGADVTRTADGVLQVSVGPLFWVHFGYSTLLLATATVVLIRSLLRVSERYRPQTALLVVASLLPWVASLLFNWPGTPVTVDPSPVVFAAVEMVFVWGLGRFQLFNLMPLARSLVVEHLPQPIFVMDPYERIVDANAAMHEVLAAAHGAVLGGSVPDLLPTLPEDWVSAASTAGQRPVVRLGGQEGVAEYEVRVISLETSSTTVPARVVVLDDATARRRTERRLAYVMSHDLMTDLPNRRMLDEHLSQVVDAARTAGGAGGVGLLFVDLDDFRRVNDQAGYAVGDLVLRQTFLRVSDLVGPAHVTGRWGGDELVVILSPLDSPEQAGQLAERICAAVREPIAALGSLPVIGASVGVATSPPLPLDAATLLSRADAAMHEAKATPHDTGRVVHAAERPTAEPPQDPRMPAPAGVRAEPASGPRGPDAGAERRWSRP